MTNIITTDASTFKWVTYRLIGVVTIPIQITLAVYMLWKYLGLATFAGLASMLVFIPINFQVAKMTKKLIANKSNMQDSRLKSLNELFSGIRVVKLMGWELCFEKLIMSIRNKELNILIKTSIIEAIHGLIW